MNDDGIPENNPTIAYKSTKLMPLGGNEVNSGYKGYGLGMLVEILCGILSGKVSSDQELGLTCLVNLHLYQTSKTAKNI